MGLDGIFLHAICLEIEKFKNARVEKISQISEYELVICLKKQKKVANLLISVSATNPLIYFAKNFKKSSLKIFNFESLIKNRLKNSYFIDVFQAGLDRVLYLNFSAKDEIGSKKEFVLAVELIARYGNIILFNKKTLEIEDAIKRVYEKNFLKRPILPKQKFIMLKEQEKLNILKEEELYVLKKIISLKEKTLEEALFCCLQGVSKFVASCFAKKFKKKLIFEFNEQEKTLLFNLIVFLKNLIVNGNFCFVVILKEGLLKDFSFFDVSNFCSFRVLKKFDSASELINFFYEEEVFYERELKKTNSVVKFLNGAILKTKNKIKAREQDLNKAKEKSHYKEYGDLIISSFNKIKKGQTNVILKNYYDGEDSLICLKLNPRLNVAQNAQEYYKKFKKSITAKKKLEELILAAKEELQFLQNELVFVRHCTNEEDLFEIEKELQEEGYCFCLENLENKSKKQKQEKKDLNFLKFKTEEGFYFFCGKNGKQNDFLTTKRAKKEDLWFHVEGFAGSHVVLLTNGKKEIPYDVIVKVATVAAYYSKARNEKKVYVNYTLAKNVSKPKGAKAGLVLVKNFKSVMVFLDYNIVEKLRID